MNRIIIGSIFIAAIVMSCKPQKDKSQDQLVLPVSARSIDSLTIDPNNDIHYQINIISPLPENMFAAQPEMKRIDGDTTIYFHKLATIVADSAKPFIGHYEFVSKGNEHFASIRSKIIKLQFWRDSVSTIDTVLQLK